MAAPLKAIADLALVLVPKLIKSREARKEAKEKAKKAVKEPLSNSVALAAVSTSGAVGGGVIQLPPVLAEYEMIIHAVLLIIAYRYAKHTADEN